MVHINRAAMDQQFRSFKHGSLVPQAGSWVPTHGDPWST